MIKLFFLVVLVVSCSSFKSVELDRPYADKKVLNVKWVKNLDPKYSTGNLPIGTSSPFIYEDILFMGNLKGEMVAYELESGREIWKKNEKYPIQSKANFYNDHVYYGTKSGRLFSRHYVSGKLKFSIDLGAPIESQPIFHQGRVFLHLRNHTIVCLDASSGKIFWLYQRSIPYTTTLQRVSHVMPMDNKLFVGFADGYLVSLSLEEGTLNWEEKISTGLKFIDVDVSPVKLANYIVAGSAAGPMRFLRPESGVIDKTVEYVQSHTPLVEKDSIVVGSVFGEVARVDKFGKILKRKKLSSNGISSIAAYKNHFVVSTMGSEIFFINKDTFSIIDDFDLGHGQSAVFGDLVVMDNYLSIYSSRNRLYVLK